MADDRNRFKRIAVRETALFLGLLFFGIALLPLVIYVVGQQVFGSYGGHGYGEFVGELTRKLRSGDPYAWFLVLSPYFVWQTLRLVVAGWATVARADQVR